MFGSFFKSLNGKKSSTEAENNFHYASIPARTARALEAESYPQRPSPIPNFGLNYIRDRYATQLRELLDNLPFRADEVEQLVIPVLRSAIELVHMLPASETHHHSGQGGLLVHSLEAAIRANVVAKTVVFDPVATQEEKYNNRNRWVLAAVLTALLHDIGKCFDVIVNDDEGLLWNPETEGLMDWISTNNIERYYVSWRADRTHKQHEVKSLRLAYQRIFTKELIEYLSSVTGPRIMDAIDAAITKNEGPLGKILLAADQYSVECDLERRRSMDAKTTVISAPVVPPILTAIQQNVESKLWSVNCKGAQIFVMPDGVYMAVRDAVGADIRATAYVAGHTNVPKAIDEIIQILRDAGSIVLSPVTEDGVVEVVWSIHPEPEEKSVSCVKFDSADRVFPNGNAPIAVPSAVAQKNDKPTKTDVAPEEKHTTIGGPTRPAPIPKPLRLSEKKAVAETSEKTLSDADISEKPSVPLSAEDCQMFLRKLIARIASELKNGGGAITGSVTKDSENLACSSLTVEHILENHDITVTTLVSFLRMNGSGSGVRLNPEAHRILLKL